MPATPSDPFPGAVVSPAAGSPDAGHGWADPLLARWSVTDGGTGGLRRHNLWRVRYLLGARSADRSAAPCKEDDDRRPQFVATVCNASATKPACRPYP